jgi:hypothetical protein
MRSKNELCCVDANVTREACLSCRIMNGEAPHIYIFVQQVLYIHEGQDKVHEDQY